MTGESERVWAVKALLLDFVKSPSLRHMRDEHFINRLARDIVKQIDQSNLIWTKWDGQRDVLMKMAAGCWIPVEDLRDCLNRLPGPPLTSTDVTQREKALEAEYYFAFSPEELRSGCSAIYEREKAAGTELPAIAGLLRDHLEQAEEQYRNEQAERYQRARDEEQTAREQRLNSGADCKWTQIRKSPCWYCRVNGRTFRLSPTEDKKWNFFRVKAVSDDEDGAFIGKYLGRGDATKVIAQVAYQPEPRW